MWFGSVAASGAIEYLRSRHITCQLPPGPSLRHQLARIGDDTPHLLELLRACERRDDLGQVSLLCERLVVLGEWRPVWRIALRYLRRSEPRPVSSCRHATVTEEEGWRRCSSCGAMWQAHEAPAPEPNGSPVLAQQAANLVRLLIDISMPQCPQQVPHNLEEAVGDAPLGEAGLLLYTIALLVWSTDT